jgi:hypothetical protein
MTVSMSSASAISSYGVKYPSAKFWHDTKANVTLRTIELPGGLVRVRPTGLIQSPTLKR